MTPEFDRIALQSTLLEQAITLNPVWAPARSALLTPTRVCRARSQADNANAWPSPGQSPFRTAPDRSGVAVAAVEEDGASGADPGGLAVGVQRLGEGCAQLFGVGEVAAAGGGGPPQEGVLLDASDAVGTR